MIRSTKLYKSNHTRGVIFMELSFNGDDPYYLQIYRQIREKIIQHHLLLHTKLPSKRQLARDLGVSVHTIQEAYAQLIAEGYIESKERSGYFVAAYDYERLVPKQQQLYSSPPKLLKSTSTFTQAM